MQQPGPGNEPRDHVRDPPPQPRSRLRWLLTAGLIFSLAAMAWGFTGLQGELRLRDAGLSLDKADQARDAAFSSRTHLGDAVQVALLGEAQPATDLTLLTERSLALAEADIDKLQGAVADMLSIEANSGLTSMVNGYVVAVDDVAAALRSEDLGTADALFTSTLAPRFEAVSGELTRIRTGHLAVFLGGSGLTQIVLLAIRFALAVGVPLAATLVVLDAMRRREAHRRLEFELEVERDLTRAKDEFIANVSHELRTPLTIIHGFATVLEEEALTGAPGDAARYIARESDELTRMVDDLLTAARADADALVVQTAPVPVRSAIDAVLPAINREGEPVEVDVEPAYVDADPFRLRQIVRNLLSNARKHGGDRISVHGVVDGDMYALTISDDGPGVSPHVESRLFERFVHGNEDRLLAGSVGLGLAIVRSLVERMGGTIRYDRVDPFTRFVVRLPVANADDHWQSAGARSLGGAQ